MSIGDTFFLKLLLADANQGPRYQAKMVSSAAEELRERS